MRATISADGVYRYDLWRALSSDPGLVTFIMLNPSTADAEKDDPTIRRCMGFAARWGYGRLRVVNLFPLRATDPAELLRHPKPEGYDNENCDYLRSARVDSDLCVAAWGAHSAVKRLSEEGRAWIGPIDGVHPMRVLGVTKAGAPRHPLYLPNDAPQMVWSKSIPRSRP